jgi:hypothetical protein
MYQQNLLVPSAPNLTNTDGIFYQWMEKRYRIQFNNYSKGWSRYWIQANADGHLLINMPKDGVVF